MVNDRKPAPHAEALLFAALVAGAVLARWVGWRVQTDDMHIFTQWYHKLGAAGAWRGIGAEIGNYNAPFIYLLAVVLYLPGPIILKMKAAFVVFDVVLAWYTYKIVGLRWPGRRIPAASALVMVMLPTVVLNASFYGQMDSMWAAFALGGVYHLLRDKPWHAVALCGVAFAVKPQGIFIFPLLLLLALAGRIPWRTLVAAPAVYLALDAPAILFGRDPVELLTVYAMSRQARNVPALSLRAPSAYAFVPAGPHDDVIRNLGYVFTAVLVLGVCYVLVARAVEMDPERVVTLAALFALMVPFLLPGMHERYFYLADVTCLVLAVYRPRLWFVPLLVQAGSLLSYLTYLLGGSRVPETVPATLMLAALIALGHDVLKYREKRASRPAAVRPAPLPARRA